MKKIIVTGGLGFIGSNLIDLLISKSIRLLPINPNPPVTIIFFISIFNDLEIQLNFLPYILF